MIRIKPSRHTAHALAILLTIVSDCGLAMSQARADDQSSPIVLLDTPTPPNRPDSVGGATAEPTIVPTSSSSVSSTPPDAQQPQIPPATIQARTYGIYSFRNTWNGSADVQADHTGLAVDMSVPLTLPLRFNMSTVGEFSHYGFSNTAAVLPAPRFAVDGYALAIQPGLALALAENFALFAGPTIQSTAQFGADFQRSLTYGGDIGAYYKMNPKLSVTLGLGASTRLSHAAYFYPVVGIDWQFNTDWRCTIQTQDFGANARLSRTLIPDVALSLIGGYAQREYRLNSHGVEPDGLLRDFYVPVGLELAYARDIGPSIRLDVGTSIIDDIRFDDRSGNKVARHNTNPAPFVGLAAAWKF